MDTFLQAIPQKHISEEAYTMILATIRSSLSADGHVPLQLQLALLTYVNSCENMEEVTFDEDDQLPR